MSIPFDPQMPLNVDSTMIVCARGCLRKFYNEFVLGLRPPGVSIDLHAGGCFATALEVTYREHWQNGRSLAESLDRARAAFFVQWGEFVIPEWKKTAKDIDRMWEAVSNPLGDMKNKGYFDVYPPQTDEILPYFDADGKPTLEYTFAIPLEPCTAEGDHNGSGYQKAFEDGYFPCHPSGGPFIYCGRFDKLGSYRHEPIVCDEKTTGASIGAAWVNQWRLRNQFMGYVWACQQCGIPVTQVAVRGIAIQKTQIVHAQSIQPYTADQLVRWHEQLRRDLWKIRRAWDSGYWDYNFGDTCNSYGSCIFLDACSSVNPEPWLSNLEVRRWNPLVKNPIAVPDLATARAF